MTPQGWIALGAIFAGLQLLMSGYTLLKVAFLAGELRQQVRNNTDEIEKLRKWRESVGSGITVAAHKAHGGLN